MKRSLAVETRELRKLAKTATDTWWKIGRRLSRVSKSNLYTANGHATLKAYIEAELDLPAPTALQYMRVARVFEPQVCQRFGVGKLDWLIAHAERTPEDDDPRDLVSKKVGQGPKKRSFAETPLADLREIGREERGEIARGKKDAAASSAVLEMVQTLARVVDSAVGKRLASFADVDWHESKRDTLLDITGIPMQHAKKVFRALYDALD